MTPQITIDPVISDPASDAIVHLAEPSSDQVDGNASAGTRTRWPCMPGQPVTLWTMLHIHAENFETLIGQLNRMTGLASQIQIALKNGGFDPSNREDYHGA